MTNKDLVGAFDSQMFNIVDELSHNSNLYTDEEYKSNKMAIKYFE